MLVIDTSAALAAITAGRSVPRLTERLDRESELGAPHLIDTEVLHALRRMRMCDAITEERAADTRTDFADLRLIRFPHAPLSDRVWELRHNLSAYDATFIALAEALSAPLVTCDRRLAGAPGHGAHVELFAVGSEPTAPGRS